MPAERFDLDATLQRLGLPNVAAQFPNAPELKFDPTAVARASGGPIVFTTDYQVLPTGNSDLVAGVPRWAIYAGMGVLLLGLIRRY